jgi:hypothetical protein
VDEIALKPERDVARALVEQLPSDCLVYHSYPWLREDRSDRNVILREGEVDFVVVLPPMGILILEVKGGCIEYDPTDHVWYRVLPNGRRKEIKDPFKQAAKNTHELERRIAKEAFPGQKNIPCAFGYAVVFPDCTYTGSLPPGAESSIVLSARDLPYLGRRIPEVLAKWSRRADPRTLTQRELDGVLKGLSPVFKLLPVLFRKIEEQEERLFRLTEEQLRLLDFLARHLRAAIEGVAGSGKTMLAKAQAQRFADQGRKTLLLCYNRVLAEWLQKSLPEQYAERIDVSHFHRLCRKLCVDAGLPFEPNRKSDSGFWREEAALLFMEAIERTSASYDAIVVDEGQDFFPDWWTALNMMSAEDGAFYVFYDPAQNLYVGEDLLIPNLGPPVVLPTNCRNTRRIATTCGRIKGIEIPIRKDSPDGDDPVVRVATTPEQQVRACEEWIREWILRGKLEPSQVVIQCPHRRENSALAGVQKLAGVPLVESLDLWEAGKGVLFTTIRGFKGLEADAAIIADVPPPESLPHFGTSDLYVACSRAKHLLVVLLQEEVRVF